MAEQKWQMANGKGKAKVEAEVEIEVEADGELGKLLQQLESCLDKICLII